LTGSSDEVRNERFTTQSSVEELAAEYGVKHAKLMWKIDVRIVPAICALYLLAFLDRVNIANANVYGMSTDIHLTNNQYNTALAVFFVPYVIFEIPSNYMVKRFKPHTWLPFCMVCFGVVSIGQGFVKNFGQLIATRFLLGMFEAGMFPGCFYLLSMWYNREEAQKRYSFFFSSTSLAGAFGGLIAYGVSHIDGRRGLASWRWLYIIEGSVTAFVAALLYFGVSDFPEDAKYLSDKERSFIQAKLALDSGDSSYHIPLSARSIARVFKDWKVWLTGVMYFCPIIPAYGYAYFSPAIIKDLNYSAVQTQLRSIPPWVLSFGTSMITAVLSDRTRHRYGYTIFTGCVAIAGFIMLLADKKDVHVRYGALFLASSGVYSFMPVVLCWTNLNFSGHHRRAVGTAWQVGFGNIGGIVATYSFLTKEAPLYTKGVSLCFAFIAFGLVCNTVYLLGIIQENKKKRNGTADNKWLAMTEEERLTAGDLNPRFRYTY
jgi:MFS family permease